MRLKFLRCRKGELTPLEEYLCLRGYSDDVVETGLESFVADWEERVSWYVCQGQKNGNVFGLCDIDFGHDVWRRNELHILLQHASDAEKANVQQRMDEADRKFREVTIKSNFPVFDYIDDPDPKMNWWLFRIPLDGLH